MDEKLKELARKIADLGFDYDRMSISGQQTYDEILIIMATLQKG